MKKKGKYFVLMVCALCLAGCSSPAGTGPSETAPAESREQTDEDSPTVPQEQAEEGTEASTVEQGSGTAGTEESEPAAEQETGTDGAEESEPAAEQKTGTGEAESPSAADTETAESQAAADSGAAGGYEDNFAVDSAAAAEFARQIKAAVSEKDLEKLADLIAFPVYVGFQEGGVPVENRNEFLALGADKFFTQELIESVEAADEDALSPSRAGFVLSDGSKANIIFAVNEGKLTVVGINY